MTRHRCLHNQTSAVSAVRCPLHSLFGWRKAQKGFSLVEIIIAIGIFGLIAGSVAVFSSESLRSSRDARVRFRALGYVQEVRNAVVLSKAVSWGSIIGADDGAVKHLEFADGRYTFVDGPSVRDGVTLSIRILPVSRDVNGDLVESGGMVDHHSRKIEITSEWNNIFGLPTSSSSSFFVNDWNTRMWEETTTADFSQGILAQTTLSAIGDGAVELAPKLYANWCIPELMITTYDLPGSAVGNVVTADPGNAYVGTGKEFTDPGSMSFMHMTTDSTDPPSVSVTGTFSGYVVNDIFGEPGYAYLATTSDTKEVVILDISQSPFAEVGYFDASGTTDALAVFVVGNRGYVTQGRNLRVFDLSAKTGARTQLGTIQASPFQLPFMTASVTDVVVVGNYAYCSLYNDWYEMTIVNVSNPASMSIATKADFNWAQATALFVSVDGNRAYIGTGSSSGKEFFIINTTNKSSVSVVNSYESNGMSVKGLSVIENKAILVGRNGEEYQVVDVSNEAALTRCGGMQINEGISDVATINFGGILFSYILTGNAAGEFKIIRGGLDAGGGGDGRGYVTNGTFESQVLDTNSDTTSYFYIEWDETLQTGTDVQIQVRSGSSADLSGEPWVGPDGTSGSFFSDPAGEELPQTLSNHRYFQYRVVMGSDTDHTPEFESLRITYQ